MKTHFSFRLAAWLVSFLIIIYGLYALQDVIVPLLFAVLFSVLLYPLCRKLERWRLPRIWAILVSQAVFITIIGFLIYLATVQVLSFSEEVPLLSKKIEKVTEKTQNFVRDQFKLSKKKQLAEGKKLVGEILKSGVSAMTNAVAATTGTLTSAVLIPLYVFFFLLYRDFFRNFIFQLFDNKYRRKVRVGIHRIYEVIQGYIVGLVVVIMIVGALNSAGLLLLGVDYAVFFGFFAAFLLLIPYIGIMIGSILPALMALITKDSPMYAVGVLGLFGFIQFLEGNFITPNIVGSKISINPLVAMIVLILGGNLWGVSGLILALPITAIIKVIFDLIEPLKPYGYLLGEAEEQRPPIVKVTIPKK